MQWAEVGHDKLEALKTLGSMPSKQKMTQNQRSKPRRKPRASERRQMSDDFKSVARREGEAFVERGRLKNFSLPLRFFAEDCSQKI
jgi:hypothetical protein